MWNNYGMKNIPWGEKMKNQICAIWTLDKESNDKLEYTRKALTDFSIDYEPIYGHITMAHFYDIDIDDIVEYTREFVQDKSTFHVRYSIIGLLSPNCIACIPTTSGKLLEYYYEYHEQFDAHCDDWTKIEKGLWLPHSTLYFNLDIDLGPIIMEMARRFEPFEGKIVRLELSEIDDDGIEVIYTHKLAESSNF